MALYTYGDWVTYPDSNPAAKLARLRLHIQEVSQSIGPDVTKGGSSRSSGSPLGYLQSLKQDETKYAALANQKNGTRAYRVNMNGSAP
jgi:hypothetical protein